MKYLERFLWAAVVVALVIYAATDPWFTWWWAGGIALYTVFVGGVCFFVGFEEGHKAGHTRGYQIGVNAPRARG